MMSVSPYLESVPYMPPKLNGSRGTCSQPHTQPHKSST